MGTIAIVGAGFVADYYMRSVTEFPEHSFVGVWDIDPVRLARFSAHWTIPAASGLDEILNGPKRPDLLLNLTNPRQHYAINRAALEADLPVYCEKPLATTLEEARNVAALAAERGVPIASAPCSVLGPSAQAMWAALRQRRIGKPHLVYAELDDGYVPQASYEKWRSEVGTPWPARDEFEVGCTLEHAGYYLTWMMAMFGPVRTVVAASACLVKDKLGDGTPTAPDWSTALLYFDDDVVARLTCTIIGRHDHRMRIFGERGTLAIGAAWSNFAPVHVLRRITVRRRLVDGALREKVPLPRPPWRRGWRKPAMAMNLMLGPDEMLSAMAAGRPPRLGGDFALHLTEVTLAIQNSGHAAGAQTIHSTFEPMVPMPWARGGRRRETGVDAIKLGIVGTGAMAALMTAAARFEPRIRIVAVASKSSRRAEAFAGEHGIERAYGSLHEMLAGDVDAVYVANEPSRHVEAALAAVRAGKPTLVEKPFATRPEDAERAFAAAREAGVLLMEALWTPFLPAQRRAVALATDGTLGEPVHLAMEFGYPAAPAAYPGLFRPEDGGAILDRMVYPLALALAVFGEVADMSAAVTVEGGVDVHASLQLRHAGGGISQLTTSLVTLMSNTARIACTGGTVRIEDPVVGAETLSVRRVGAPDATSMRTAPSPGAGARARLVDRLKRSGTLRRIKRAVGGSKRETHSYGPNQYAPLLAHFAGLVARGAVESDVVPHELSLSLQRLLPQARGAVDSTAAGSRPSSAADAATDQGRDDGAMDDPHISPLDKTEG